VLQFGKKELGFERGLLDRLTKRVEEERFEGECFHGA